MLYDDNIPTRGANEPYAQIRQFYTKTTLEDASIDEIRSAANHDSSVDSDYWQTNKGHYKTNFPTSFVLKSLFELEQFVKNLAVTVDKIKMVEVFALDYGTLAHNDGDNDIILLSKNREQFHAARDKHYLIEFHVWNSGRFNRIGVCLNKFRTSIGRMARTETRDFRTVVHNKLREVDKLVNQLKSQNVIIEEFIKQCRESVNA